MATRSLNRATLIGNLTRDPNLRFTPGGTPVCSFGLATNRSWTPNEGGERVEKAEFHNIVAWGKLAEICGDLLTMGDKVYVEGRIQTRDWKTEAGEDRRITEIVIDNMILLRSKKGIGEEDDYQSGRSSRSSQVEEVPVSDDTEAEDVSDEIPF